YGKLTRNHYRVVSISPIPAARRYQAVRGISPYEPSFREPRYRWLAPDAALAVWPRGARRARATLGLPPQAPLATNTVTVEVAGQPVATVTVPRDGTAQAEIPLPPLSDTAEVEIAFRAAASFVPAAAGISPDRRTLAVELRDFVLIEP